MTDLNSPGFEQLLENLRTLSADLETGDGNWPAAQLERLADAGVLGWSIPKTFGGTAISPVDFTDGYVRLASACLTTTFILTQRNGACQRIAGSDNDDIKQELLPRLCTADTFATVGISHLTTSRQYLKQPAMQVEERGDQFIFRGRAPWVTGAVEAEHIVTGGTLSDGRQLLAAVPTDLPGITINPAPHLLALNESQTGSVRFDDVAVDRHWLLAGPIEEVMKQGIGGGTGSLTTSALALGAAKASIDRLEEECENRPDLLEIHEPLAAEQSQLYEAILTAANPENANAGITAASIRTKANSLVMRAAHAYLTAAKGAGFVSGHPAERAVREATFFLVWSCPQPVQTAAMREFACVVSS